jgi:mono/diheme cytochrome c family protein
MRPGYQRNSKRAALSWAVVGLLTVGGWMLSAGTVARGADERVQGQAAKGKLLFVKHCTGCHGPEGQGDGYKLLGPDPANLTAPSTAKKSDADLLDAIHEGRPNMPAWKLRLSKEDSRDVLAYIRSLGK